MRNVTIDDVRKHYQRTHTAANMRFIIGGNITPSRLEVIERFFSEIELPAGRNRLTLPDERPHILREPLYIRNRTVDNLYFCIDTFMRRRMSEPESDALDLLNIILTETLSSKILGTARERGLVYDINSGYTQLREISNWGLSSQVIPENALALFEIIIEELAKVFSGQLTAKEIEAAQAYALGRFQRSAQTVGGTTGGYVPRYFKDDVVEDYYQVPKRIKAVTKQAMVDIARDMFDEGTWGIGVLGNCSIDLVRELRSKLEPIWSHQTWKS